MEFEVKIRCVVTKVVTVQCDDEKKVRTAPWEWATHEIETDLIDWEVESVTCTEADDVTPNAEFSGRPKAGPLE